MVIKSKEVAYSQMRAQFSVLVKLQINKDYNKEAFKAIVRRLLRCLSGVSITEVGNNLYMATFDKGSEMEEIIAKGPWPFNKCFILLKRLHGDTSPFDVKFPNAYFWIRVFNIPVKSMNRDVSSRLANEIGEYR